jgi:hypothetical protein
MEPAEHLNELILLDRKTYQVFEDEIGQRTYAHSKPAKSVFDSRAKDLIEALLYTLTTLQSNEDIIKETFEVFDRLFTTNPDLIDFFQLQKNPKDNSPSLDCVENLQFSQNESIFSLSQEFL